MNCGSCRTLLLRYLHGELEDRADEVALHLKECPACRRQERIERNLWNVLGADQPPVPDVDLVPALRRRIAARHTIRWVRIGVAAAVVVLAVGWLLPLPRAVRPPLPSADLAAYDSRDRLMDRHPSRVPVNYPYIDGYDRAVSEGHYISFVENGLDESDLRIPGASLAQSDASFRLYSTPRGTLSVFIEAGDAPAVHETVVRQGREFKLSSFSVRGTRYTLVSDRLPWPEIALFEQALQR